MNGMNDLDDLFAEARRQAVPPSAGLVARVMADAEALQPRPAALSPAPAPRSFWAGFAGFFAGAGAMAGMGTAAVAAGLFLGIAQPAPVAALTDALGVTATDTSYDFLPGIDPLIDEE